MSHYQTLLDVIDGGHARLSIGRTQDRKYVDMHVTPDRPIPVVDGQVIAYRATADTPDQAALAIIRAIFKDRFAPTNEESTDATSTEA